MTGLNPFCPMGGLHRVYYSARVARGFVPAFCRDCGLNVHFVAGMWQTAPMGEILLGWIMEFESKIIDGDLPSTVEPRGIFGIPVVESDVVTEIDRMIDPINLGRVSIIPPMPRIPS